MYKKFIWLMAIIFMTVNLAGCGAGKVIKSASKTVGTQSKKIAKEGATDLAIDAATSAIIDNSPSKNTPTSPGKTSTVMKGAAAVAGGAAVTAAAVAAADSLGDHWIQDANTGVYLWNPEPTDGETVYWSGGYVQDGNYKFADGRGTVTWQRYGKTTQVDEGGFSHGRHHGQFKHTFTKSGRVEYSNWNNGVEIR